MGDGRAPSMDWPRLVPEPRWSEARYSTFAIAIDAVRNAENGLPRAAAYYALAENLRLAPDGSVALLDASAHCYIAAHIHRPTAAAYLNLGVVLQQAGRLSAAASAYRLAIHHDSEPAAAHRNLAILTRRTEGAAAAAPLLRTALTLNPLSSALHHSYGEALLSLGRPAEAVLAMRSASSLLPSQATARERAMREYGLGAALLQSRQMDAASHAFARAVALYPSHAIHTARNDANASEGELVRWAELSAKAWAVRAAVGDASLPEDLTTATHGEGQRESMDETPDPAVVELEWTEDGGSSKGCAAEEVEEERVEEEGWRRRGGGGGVEEEGWRRRRVEGAHEAVPRHCAVVETDGSAAAAADAIAAHANLGRPVLLRNLSAEWAAAADAESIPRLLSAIPPRPHTRVGGAAADDVHERCRGSNWSAFVGCTMLPVSLIFEDGRTNRILPMEDLAAGRLPPAWRLTESEERSVAVAAQAALRNGRTHGVLQRPPRVVMHAATLLSLLSRGQCRGCYAKQVDLPLHLPSVLRLLRPPPLRDTAESVPDDSAEQPSGQPLEGVNLWLGSTRTQRDAPDPTTDLHHDMRPNVLTMLRGTKRVLVIPPADAAERLRPATLIDVQTRAAPLDDVHAAATAAAQRPFFARGRSWADEAALLDRNHYLMTLVQARQLLRPRRSGAARQKREPPCSFMLRASDGIYIPPKYVHAVETIEGGDDGGFAVAVNFFYANPIRSAGARV